MSKEKLLPLTRMEKVTLVIGKTILTMDEAILFLGLSKSAIYKKTSSNNLPHYKQGKKLYFKKSELEDWMLSNAVKTLEQIEEEAASFIHLKKAKAC